MNKILELREKRAKAWDAAKAFLDTKRSGDGLVSAEDTATYDKMEADVVALGKEIERLERQSVIDAELEKATSNPITNAPSKTPEEKTGRASDEYKRSFWNAMRARAGEGLDPAVRNALQIGTDTEDGYICIKANSVTEREVIDQLMKASQAGVEIQLIIRGICCILPGVGGYTENVHITSIVGRYLEHSRIYMFGRGEDAEFYISSADLMTRNLNRRVEIACPVYDVRIREQLKWLLESQLSDTAKASIMLSDGSYCRKHSDMPFDSQDYFMRQSPHVPEESTKKHGASHNGLIN